MTPLARDMRMCADDRRDRAQPHLVGEHRSRAPTARRCIRGPNGRTPRPAGWRPGGTSRSSSAGVSRSVCGEPLVSMSVRPTTSRPGSASTSPWPNHADAGGVERPGGFGIARRPEIHRMVVGEADAGDVEPLQPCGRQFLRHGERHVVDRLGHVGQDDAFEIDDQRPRLGAGEDLVRDAIADLLVEQHLLHRAAEIRRRRRNSRSRTLASGGSL